MKNRKRFGKSVRVALRSDFDMYGDLRPGSPRMTVSLIRGSWRYCTWSYQGSIRSKWLPMATWRPYRPNRSLRMSRRPRYRGRLLLPAKPSRSSHITPCKPIDVWFHVCYYKSGRTLKKEHE